MIKNGFRKKIVVAAIFPVVLFIGAFAARSYNMHRFHVEKQTRFMMDTFVSMFVVGPPDIGAEAIKLAFERMQAASDKFNNRDPNGPIYAFNHHGTPITDPEILHVAEKALEISRRTGGAFDITVEPLVELWGFYGDTPTLPDDAAIQACLQHIGYRHLNIDSGVMTKDDPAIRIDMGGIAKGYCVSQAAAVLRDMGIESALIDAGGDVFALGRRGEELWKVGIRSPRGNDILGFMEVENLAVMGSGDYERFFEQNGTRYHHIFDPRTGYPVEGVSSATLLHADPMLADAWNTAVFVLGAEKGRAIVETLPGMEVVMITDTADVRVSSGLANALRLNSETNLSIARRQ
ncbi:MAG: FAD:protein FMN transferase [Desulfosarcina sp.]